MVGSKSAFNRLRQTGASNRERNLRRCVEQRRQLPSPLDRVGRWTTYKHQILA